jgi:hypothetical protein
MTARDIFEAQLAVYFKDEQRLDAWIRSTLNKPLNNFVASASMPIMITGLLSALESDQAELLKFLAQLITYGGTSEVRGTARGYLDESMNIVSPQADPYKDLIVLGQPFADRQTFREKLKDLLNLQYNRTLAANGPRYCGRSHSRMLVRHVGQKTGVRVAVVDLLKSDVGEAVSDLINEMQLDVRDTRDRMAQFPTQTKGFLSALKGIAQSQFVQNNTRWCIVFDHHDLDETPPERKEFAEAMIRELMENTLPNIWVVMLGLGSCQYLAKNYESNIMKVDLLRLGLTDIETYINALHVQKNNQPLNPAALQVERDKVLADLTMPLQTIQSMESMALRLQQYF